MDFHPYPTSVPSAAIIGLVMEAINNRVVNVKETTHAVWHVTGFGLSKWDVHQAFGSTQDEMKKEDALYALENLKASVENPEKFGAITIPWNVLLPFLITLLQKLLK